MAGYQKIKSLTFKIPGCFVFSRVLFLEGCVGFVVLLVFIWLMILDGTTACEKPLFQIVFVFEHFFYSSANLIL
jgi:hypothetical protein